MSLKFWRFYSSALTLAVLGSFLVVSVFSVTSDSDSFGFYSLAPLMDDGVETQAGTSKMRINDGLIQYAGPFGDTWTNLSFPLANNPPNSISQSTLDGYWQQFADATGLSSVGGGGLTQPELNGSLQDYVGKFDSSYNFLGYTGSISSYNVSDLYDAIAKNQIFSTYPLWNDSGNFLLSDGTIGANGGSNPITTYIRAGFAGLHQNLVGSSALNYSFSRTDLPALSGSAFSILPPLVAMGNALSYNTSDIYSELVKIYSQDANMYQRIYSTLIPAGGLGTLSFLDSSDLSDSPVDYTNITEALVDIGTSVQSDLAKLRYVLASDQDIEIEKANESVKNQIVNDFTGSGGAAVKPSDVGDLAGISGDIQGSFSTGASATDVISALNNSDNWNFFSQDTASQLNMVPHTISDDDDFIHFYDPSVLEAYLSGGD